MKALHCAIKAMSQMVRDSKSVFFKFPRVISAGFYMRH